MNENVADNLLLTTVYISRLLAKHARNRKVRVTAFSVLNNLEHWGRPAGNRQRGVLTQKELAEMEDVTQATMSTLVAELSEQGYVSCRKSATDKRSVEVKLTSKGATYLAREGDAMRGLIAGLLEGLSATDLDRLSTGQNALAEALLKSSDVQSQMKTKVPVKRR